MKRLIQLQKLFLIIFFLVCLAFLPGSNPAAPVGVYEKARFYARQVEFDYVRWGWLASLSKLEQSSLGVNRYLNDPQQKQLVLDYIDLVRQFILTENQIEQIYSDPQVQDPQTQSQQLRDQLAYLEGELSKTAPLAESVLQMQISAILGDLDLTVLGQPIPPVLFQVTQLPKALIISPRSVIRQDAFVSLQADLPLEQIVKLEDQIALNLDVSTMVEDVGGIGMYPTMIIRTTNLSFLIEVVSHEWIHNYLTLRPLGVNYDTSPELRVMNETTANLAGKEISRAVIERYYPELLPKPQPVVANSLSPSFADVEQTEPVFDFRAEMHETRLKADELLAGGKIEEAEQYMEARRQIFVQNGYRLRKLNQAYFAFHGAYADTPGGAAGQDPYGPAVVELRQRSPSLAAFLRRIARMTSFNELQQALQTP
jgi:hypothetical protein